MAEYIDKESAIKAVSENDYEGYATIAVKAIHAANVRENVIRTQADRIRAMSDEELAGMLSRVETDGRAYGPSGKAYWLNWLQSPAGGEFE